MSYIGWAVVIFVTFLLVFLVAAYRTGEKRYQRIMLAARLDEAMGRTQLPRAGWLEVEQDQPFQGASLTGQPWPDTRPLLLMSDHAAAQASLEREVRAMVRAAEQAIPERWRT